MNQRRSRVVVLVWAVGGPLALLTVVMILVALAQGDISPTTTLAPLSGALSVVAGAALVTRLPGNRIGWLLWFGGLLIALTRVTQGLADLGLTSNPGSVPGAIWIGWVNTWIGLPAVVTLPLLLPLLYPTGHLPSPRWRIVGIAVVGAIAAGAGIAAVSPFPAGNYPPGVINPLALGGSSAGTLTLLSNLASLILFIGLVLGLGSLIVRFHRSTGIEREQLKWFAFVGSISVIAFIVAAGEVQNTTGPLATIDNFAWATGFAGLAMMPVAIGIAVLRYRLYEIDRLVSRTISWAVVSAIVAGLFVGSILLFQAVLAPITASNDFAVAGSTLLVVGLFAPIRRWVQRLVDRRFNRTRYDAERIVGAFASRLRDEVDLQALKAEILSTVGDAVEPSSVSLWLRE